MSDNKQSEDDLSSWEQQISRDLVNEDIEGIYLDNKERSMQNLYCHFQGMAQRVAVLYKTAASSDTNEQKRQALLWSAFQATAGHITAHHKACMDLLRSSGDLAQEVGSRQRSKDILCWSRKKKHIKRDELIGYLAGYNASGQAAPRNSKGLPRPGGGKMTRHSQHPLSANFNSDDPLVPFVEALQPVITLAGVRRKSSPSHNNSPDHISSSANFVVNQFVRHKRSFHQRSPSPPTQDMHDVHMDSPQHKKFKYG